MSPSNYYGTLYEDNSLAPTPPPSEEKPSSQYCDPKDLRRTTRLEILTESDVERSVQKTTGSHGSKVQGSKNKSQQRTFNDLFAELASLTEATATKSRRTRREILMDAIEHIRNVEVAAASLKAEGVSAQSEWAADSAINATDWDMLPCTISENHSQNVSCGLVDVDYGRDIADEALVADMAMYAEPESEAACLLMQMPNARQATESPKRALSITELIL